MSFVTLGWFRVPFMHGLEFVSTQAVVVGMTFGLAHGLAVKFKGPFMPSRIQWRAFGGIRGKTRQVKDKFKSGFIIGSLGGCTAMIMSWVAQGIISYLWGESFATLMKSFMQEVEIWIPCALGAGFSIGLGLGFLSWFEAPVQVGVANGPLALLRMNRTTTLL